MIYKVLAPSQRWFSRRISEASTVSDPTCEVFSRLKTGRPCYDVEEARKAVDFLKSQDVDLNSCVLCPKWHGFKQKKIGWKDR